MTEKVVPFSDMYAKLKNPVFPTIRRNDDKSKYGEVGDTVEVSVKNGESFEATLLSRREVTLESLPEKLLIFDTCPIDATEWTKSDAVEKLNSFYRNDIRETEKLTLLIYFRGV